MLHRDGVQCRFALIKGGPGIPSADAVSRQPCVLLESLDGGFGLGAELTVSSIRREIVSALDQLRLQECDILSRGSTAEGRFIGCRHVSIQSFRYGPVGHFLGERFLFDGPAAMDHHAAADVEADVVHCLLVGGLPEDAAERFRQGVNGSLLLPVGGSIPHGRRAASGEGDADTATDVLDETLAVVAQGSHIVRVIDAASAALPGAVQRLTE